GAAAAGIEQARHTVDRVALRLEPPGRGLGTTARRGQHRDGECEYGAAGGSHSILRGFLLETWRRDRPGCVAIARNAHHGAEMPRGYAGLPATFRPPAVGRHDVAAIAIPCSDRSGVHLGASVSEEKTNASCVARQTESGADCSRMQRFR